MERVNASAGLPWESGAGYSRAVRGGRVVHVSGAAPPMRPAGDRSGGRVRADGAVAAQHRARARARARLEHIVRTRIHVIDVSEWEKVGRAPGEFLGGVRPPTSMVQVSRRIDPLMLVEIEAEARLPGDGTE